MALSVECPVWRWECVGKGNKVFQVGPVAFQALLLYASEPSRVCKEVLHELCEAELRAAATRDISQLPGPFEIETCGGSLPSRSGALHQPWLLHWALGDFQGQACAWAVLHV